MKRFVQFLAEDRGKFRTDNPGGDWLKGEQKHAEKNYARSKGISGSITGYYTKPLIVNPEALRHVPGQMGEESYRDTLIGNSKAEVLEKEIGDPKNFDTSKYPILMHVNHRGGAVIGEGNHRLAYALRHKIPAIHADIRYWNGGEEVTGQWHPSQIEKIRVDHDLKEDWEKYEPFEGFHEKLHRRTSLDVLKRLGQNAIRKGFGITRFGIDHDDKLHASNGFYTHASIDDRTGLKYAGYVQPTENGLIYDIWNGSEAWGSKRLKKKEVEKSGSMWFKRFERNGIKRGRIEAT